MDKKYTIMVKNPQAPAKVLEVDEYVALCDFLEGGMAEYVSFQKIEGVALYVDDEGAMKGLKPNIYLDTYPLLGTVIALGMRENQEGGTEFCNLTEEQISKLQTFMKDNQFWNLEDGYFVHIDKRTKKLHVVRMEKAEAEIE